MEKQKQQQEGPDEASIKPVSSLKSMFEQKQAPKIAAKPPTLRQSSTLPPAQLALPNAGTQPRGSLDSSRPPSPWTHPQSIKKEGSNNADAPSKQNLTAESPKRRTSTSSLNGSSSAPTVTIDAPGSPPKPSPPSPRSSCPTPHTASSKLSNLGSGTEAKIPPPVPPQRGSRRSPSKQLTADVFPPLLPQDGGSTESKSPIIRPRAVSPMSKPPPVNRADKPSIQTLDIERLDKQTLQPGQQSRDTSVSPFTTPPSTDEDSESRARVQSVKKDLASDHHSSRRSTQDSFEKAIDASFQKPRDARQMGFGSRLDSESSRPSLPPRTTLERESPPVASKALEASMAPPLPVRTTTTHDRNHSVEPQLKRAHTSTLSRSAEPSMHPSGRHHSQSSRPIIQSVRPPSRQDVRAVDENVSGEDTNTSAPLDTPDTSNVNRRPPQALSGAMILDTDFDARLVALCGQYVCSTGRSTRIWDVSSSRSILNKFHGEKEVKVTAIAFRAEANSEEEGTRLWLGTNNGDIQELDIAAQAFTNSMRSAAHERREIIGIYRHQTSMWTLDDGGRLCVWLPDADGVPDLTNDPRMHRVPRGRVVSAVVHDRLWLATGKDVRIFRPLVTDTSQFAVLTSPLSQPSAGNITTATIIDSQRGRVYFGHSDGKVSVYSTSQYNCLSIVSISGYRIVSLAGVGPYLWAGYNTGSIHVYDTTSSPWMTKKDWPAHHGSPVLHIVPDRSSLWKAGELRVASIGSDSVIRLWDGTLENDWRGQDMSEHDTDYCSFQELDATIVTWNAGASTPTHLKRDPADADTFIDILQPGSPSDLIVLGFQELVDLEDKKLTAKSLFKGTKKKDPAEQEHMSRQYRAWRDYLVRIIEDYLPPDQPYELIHTASMVGLFSCIFIKASLRGRVRAIDTAEVKRGMGGLHGNKGAIITRLKIDDSSVCLINCHLAAGQTQTSNRNQDVAAILESTLLPPERSQNARVDTFVGGGDGSMILDNEICILNGDLNYRIDTMGRDVVIKAVGAGNYPKLLERDQLLLSRRRNPGFRLLAFTEAPITFAPTYKYDVGTDQYDSSEKRRAPAWCDRVLYRGPGKIKQLDYRRHEVRVSDHRPVSAQFKMRIKQVSPTKRETTSLQSEQRFLRVKRQMAADAKISYLRDVLGVAGDEAARLV